MGLLIFLMLNFPIKSPLPTEYKQGVADLVAEIADAPYGTVLYDHYYSWQLRYALYDTGVHLAWVELPHNLTDDLLVHGDIGTRYLILPEDRRKMSWENAVLEAGDVLTIVKQKNGLALYKID